ncbi:CopG family ribbon-helix-helix protein [Methylopila henanensis]|uniref:CopG family ribbon-helix-helix protein n=1 Tax=Methylopila henanensis TaxID=873516 RepID=A0ABW4K7N1_9HYPH
MTRRVLTVRLQPETAAALEALSSRTGDSVDELVETALALLFQDDADHVAAVTAGLADAEAGRVVPHEEAMRRFRRTIAQAALKRA